MKKYRVKSKCFTYALTAAAMLFASMPAVAHEGHADAPGTVAAPHGGKILGVSGLYLEVLRNQDELTIFPFSHDLKPVSLADLKLDLQLELPRKKETTRLVATPKGDFWIIKIDAKDAHRYTVVLSVKSKEKSGTVKYTVEK